MRFRRIRLEAFGRLRGFDTGADPLPGVVVVSGPNEAGKSSFFEAIVALLYGFYPASRETNPWAPWDGTTLSVEAHLVGDDGVAREVHRRLLSSPAASLVGDEAEEALRNRTLPGAQHVPRRVYRQVFALTLGELAALQGEGWAAVQDRLVGALGSRDLRPARLVADELEREAGGLWRPSLRGRQEVREIGERIRELEYRRSGARDEERAAREARAELERRRARLVEARREREECRVRLARDRREGPLRRRIAHLRELEAVVRDPSELEGLPRDPSAERERLERAVREAQDSLSRLESAAAGRRATIDAFDDRRRALLGHEPEIEALLTRATVAETERTRVGQLEQEVAELGRRVRATVDAVPPWRDAEDTLLLAPSAPEVRRALDEVRRERERRFSLPAGSLAWAGSLVLLVLALLLLLGDRPWPAGAAFALSLLVAAVGFALARRRDPTHDTSPDSLVRALAGLPLPPPALFGDIPTLLERIQELVRDRADRVERLEARRRGLEELETELLTFVGSLPLETRPPSSPTATLHLARVEMREAARLRERAEAAREELERLDGEHSEVVERIRTLRVERDRLDERLKALSDDDTIGGGATAAEKRLRALARSREIRAELAAEEPALLAELYGREREATSESGDPIPALLAREQGLGEEIEGLARDIERLDRDLDRFARRETLDLLDGEIRALQEERAHLVRRRDRLYLLGRLVRDADRTVREEHQPEVLRAAGRHLATLTGGRYDRILVGGEDLRSFRVRGPGTPAPIPVDTPLSTGTREQAYLALRLALLEPLDRGGERLPLVLDEVLVNWDADRLGRGLSLLADEAERRQIFLFTCHDHLADAAARATGGRHIHLPPP